MPDPWSKVYLDSDLMVTSDAVTPYLNAMNERLAVVSEGALTTSSIPGKRAMVSDEPISWKALQFRVLDLTRFFYDKHVDFESATRDDVSPFQSIFGRTGANTATLYSTWPPPTGFTRKREREITSLSVAGTDGQTARFIVSNVPRDADGVPYFVTSGSAMPVTPSDERLYSQKLMLRQSGQWILHPDQSLKADILTFHGPPKPGDLFASHILNELKAAIKELVWTPLTKYDRAFPLVVGLPNVSEEYYSRVVHRPNIPGSAYYSFPPPITGDVAPRINPILTSDWGSSPELGPTPSSFYYSFDHGLIGAITSGLMKGQELEGSVSFGGFTPNGEGANSTVMSRRIKWTANGMYAGFNKKVELYLCGLMGNFFGTPNDAYDDSGTGLILNQYKKFYETTVLSGSTSGSFPFFSNNTIPALIGSIPVPLTTTVPGGRNSSTKVRGYGFAGPGIVVKWDVAGGFQYA